MEKFDLFTQLEESDSALNKLIEKPINNIYEKYFKETFQLVKNFEKEEFRISEGCRKFYKKSGIPGYDEVFSTPKQKYFSGINENISYIFPPGERMNDKRIGFRYYMYNPRNSTKDNPYFTLVLKDYRRFEILEIDATIKDGNDQLFTVNNLNCLEIIMAIIKDKFNNNNDINYQFPYSIVEIIGFIYAMKEKSNNNIIILDPYFPSPFIPETKIEIFQYKSKTLYIEPILYKEHVSLLLFFFYENKKLGKRRYNYLFDFSYYHYKSICNKDPIFPQGMYYCEVYPRNGPIQFGSSCSIWFIGTMLTLIKMNNLSFEILDSNTLLLNIIEEISQIMNIDNAISEKIITNKEKENISNSNFISYKIALSPFINVKSAFNEFGTIMIELGADLINYQILFDEFRNRIAEIQMNFKYYEINSRKPPKDEKLIKDLIDAYNEAKEDLFNLAEYRIQEYKLIYKNKVGIASHELLMIEDKLKETKKKLNTALEQRKTKYEKFNFMSKEEILKIYIDNNDIFLFLLDK